MSLAAFISDENILDVEIEDLSATRPFDSLEICQWFTQNITDLGVLNPSTDVVDSTINISVEDILVSPPISPGGRETLLPETSGKRRSKTPAETSENRVVAERKRREKLSERFISLAALIPTLKKMDKASILEDAIKYIKEIEGKVKSLECSLKEEEARVHEWSFEDHDQELVERLEKKQEDMRNMKMMDVQVSKQNIVMRIFCENGKDIASKVLSLLDTLQLTVLNSCFFPFGTRALEITIVAKKMEDSNNVSRQDLEQKLGEIIMC